jgi:hypothetical protein
VGLVSRTIGDGPSRFSVRHGSPAAPRATRLKIGIVVLANADSTLGQLRDPDLTGANQPAAGRFAEPVEGAPLFERENALRAAVGFFALTVGFCGLPLPALVFSEGH